MTEYSDVPQANDLYQQRELVSQAIILLSQDGSGVTSMVVQGGTPTVGPPGSPPPLMPVQVVIPLPNDPTLLTAVQNWLAAREVDLDSQLAVLGVVDPPPPTDPSATKK
jgi:hypothetical protein